MDKYDFDQNDYGVARAENDTTEKYIFLCGESEDEIDQFGRFIRNSSKNI